jgi:hypothetical protein
MNSHESVIQTYPRTYGEASKFVNVKLALELAMKAQRGSTSIALLFLYPQS